MRKECQKIYLVIGLTVIFVLVSVPPSLLASANVYSVNYKDAIIVFEKTNSAGKRIIRTCSKKPNSSKKTDIPILSSLLPTHSEDLVLCQEVETCDGSGCNIVNMPTTKDKLLISRLGRFTKIVHLHQGEIKTRLLLDPPMQVLTIAQLSFLGDKIASGDLPGEFYLLAGTEPIPVRMSKIGTDTYQLKSGRQSTVKLRYENGILQRADFLVSKGDQNGKFKMVLRETVSELSEVKPKRLVLFAQDMDQGLVPSGKRTVKCDRLFDTVGEHLHLLTCEREIHEISDYAGEHIKRKLLDAGILELDKGSECIGIKVGSDAHSILPVVLEGCALEVSEMHPAITGLKRRIKRRYNHVSFRRPVEWSISHTKELVAHLHFEYKRKEEGVQTFDVSELIKRSFAGKYGEIPGKYEATCQGHFVEITGYERKPLWFDRRIGSVSLEIGKFWGKLTRRFKSSDMKLGPSYSFWFSPSSLVLGIRYIYERTIEDSAQVSIDLSRPYKDRFGLTPDAFYLAERNGAALIVGKLWDSSDRKISRGEIDKFIKNKFNPLDNAIDQEWKVKQKGGHVYLEILYRLSIPITMETITSVLEREYDVVGSVQFHMKEPQEIQCMFWGFRKIQANEEVE